jgi:hypothetical protein
VLGGLVSDDLIQTEQQGADPRQHPAPRAPVPLAKREYREAHADGVPAAGHPARRQAIGLETNAKYRMMQDAQSQAAGRENQFLNRNVPAAHALARRTRAGLGRLRAAAPEDDEDEDEDRPPGSRLWRPRRLSCRLAVGAAPEPPPPRTRGRARPPAALRLRQAPRHPDHRTDRRARPGGLPARHQAAEPGRGAAFRPRAARNARGQRGGVRPAAAARLRERLERGDADGRGPRQRPGPVAGRAGPAGTVRPAGERGRRADHPADQRDPDAGGQGKRLRHPHRALREPPRRALPHRRRAARGRAVAPRGGAAGGLAHQGHVAARHRREARAAGRPHLAEGRRARRRRARLDHSLGPRRARRDAPARQAGRPAGPVQPRHGPGDRGR